MEIIYSPIVPEGVIIEGTDFIIVGIKEGETNEGILQETGE
ncbi:hypothetical protein HNR63_001045 [Anoxybacillus kamchatkensis]|nr:hypothetical protein [Anoxybacillus ayderensis]MBA2877991.1 hypothetical protein [Anoxybacillus ayderensis]